MGGVNKIITKHKELYVRLNQLHLMNEVKIKSFPNIKINEIIKRINGKENVLSFQKINDMIIIHKHRPFNFNVYYRR